MPDIKSKNISRKRTIQSTDKSSKKINIPRGPEESPEAKKTLYTKTARKLLEKYVN